MWPGSANASQLIVKSDLFTGPSQPETFIDDAGKLSAGAVSEREPSVCTETSILICCFDVTRVDKWARRGLSGRPLPKTTFFWAAASFWSKRHNSTGSPELGT